MLVIVMATMSVAAQAQSWVHSGNGPMPGDSGPRTDAIVLRQIIDIHQSPASSRCRQTGRRCQPT